MSLRLVLVCLVAGLGICVPSWPTLEGWVASSQKWVNTRLAEMDHRRSDEANYVVIHDLLKIEMDRARAAREASRIAKRPARSQAAGSAVLANARSLRLEQTGPSRSVDAAVVAAHRAETVRPTFEPMIVGDRLYSGVAYELNFRNEGLNLPPSPVVLPLPPPSVQPADLARLVIDRYGSSGLESLRSLGRNLRDAAGRELAARQEQAAREANALAFEAMANTDNLYFADAPAPAPVVEATPEAIVAETSVFEAMEASESLYFADAPAAELMVAEATPVAPTPASLDALPDDPFAPAVAVASNERPGTVPASSEVAANSPRTPVDRDANVARPEVNRAVQLTREALYAWVNVLSGPALVTVAPSSSATR